MANSTLPLPNEYLCKASKLFPDIWRISDKLRAQLPDDHDSFFRRMYLPTFMWKDVFRESLPSANNAHLAAYANVLYCVGAWRPTQDIIRFDPTVYDSLRSTDFNGALPTEVFSQLPAWQLFVEAPGISVGGNEFAGFFAGLDLMPRLDPKSLRPEESELPVPMLTLTFLGEGPSFNSRRRSLAITKGMTLSNALTILNNSRKALGDSSEIRVDSGLVHALNLITYICSYGLISGTKPVSSSPTYPRSKKTRKGWRTFPPDKPTIRNIGQEFGDMIRRSNEIISGGGKHKIPALGGKDTETNSAGSKRAHIRRAHWHHYWTGPRKEIEKRNLTVQWLPPILVGGLEEDPKS